MSEDPDAPGSWRTAYRDLHQFPRLAFAWEYLRRNDRFREMWGANFSHWRRSGNQHNLQVFHSEVTNTVGGEDCLFAAPVDADARSATVFWNPDMCPSVLRVLALPGSCDLVPFSLEDSNLPSTLLRTKDGVSKFVRRRLL